MALSPRPQEPSAILHPVTWLRPLKSGVLHLPEKLAQFLASLQPADQVIFGASPGSVEAQLCAKLAESDARITVITDHANSVPNPKVAKLIAMSPYACHSRWILVDAEAWISPEFARSFRDEWQITGADALTAGYRFVGMESWRQWLDALSAVQTLWPGLMLVRSYGKFTFTMGACTAINRDDMARIGSWQALGNELVEDKRLGELLVSQGKTIRLSHAVLPLESDPMNWLDYWRHQRRVAITYRAVAPLGFFGTILTRGFTLSAILAAILPSAITFRNLVVVATIHLFTVAFIEARLTRRLSWQIVFTLPADTIETICWVLAWVSRRVWWAGKWRAITWRGQFRTGG